MTAKRTIRTPEQRLADAQKEIVKIKEQTIKQAADLRTQADGWTQRGNELLVRADGAREKADAILRNIGIEPETTAEQG